MIPINQISLNRVNLNAIEIYKKKAPSILYKEYLANGVDILQIMNAKENSISSFVLNGATYQDSVPTPTTPKDIVTNKGVLRYVIGNNLLEVQNYNIIVGKYINNNGVATTSLPNIYFQRFVSVKANTAYTLSTSESLNYVNFMEYDANGVFIKRTLYGSSSTPAGASTTHTMGESTAFVIVGSNVNSAKYPEITKTDVMNIKWMFNEGSSALNYEVYNGKVIVEGKDEISVYGKNLSAGELVGKGYASTGTVSTSTTFCGNLHKFPVREGQKYTVSWGNIPDGVSGVFINTWNIDGSWRQRQAISATDSLTYTIPAGVGEVNFTIYKTGGVTISEDSWMQIEYGDVVTEYNPAVTPVLASSDLLLSIGDFVDTQDIISGVITRKVGYRILNGSESISTSNNAYTIGISDKIKSKETLLCSHFSYSSSTSSALANNTIIGFASQNIGFRNDDCPDIESFRQFLQKEYAKGTPVIVVYPLQTETVENKTIQQLTNPAGDVTIIRDSEISSNMEVSLKIQKVEEDKPDDKPVTKIIEFTVNSNRYGEFHLQAEEGMTWYEWCGSEFNIYNFECSSQDSEIYTYSYYNSDWDYYDEWIVLEDINELGENIIKENAVYDTYTDSMGGW